MNTAFCDLPKEAFPLHMRAYRIDTDELVWQEKDVQPHTSVSIPALKDQLGVPVRVEIEFGNGQIEKAEP